MDDNTQPINDAVNDEDAPVIMEEPLAQDDTTAQVQECDTEPAGDNLVGTILGKLGVSESTATAAKAIIDALETTKAPTESFVKLIVNALNHDEDIKNAEAAGYLRGRNEVIEAATKPEDQDTKPVNFPIYRKRSFWDR